MCYPDGISAVMSYVCPASFDQRFDCGHDDYFSASPAPESYLATHWNTADSGWLTSDPSDTVAPRVAQPEVSFMAGGRLTSTARVRVHWQTAKDDSGIAAYELQRRNATGSWRQVRLQTPTATSVVLNLAVGATYAFRVRARDGAGNTGSWTTTGAATLTLVEETSKQIAYADPFKRVALSGASGGYVRNATFAGNRAVLTYNGTAVAFVTTLGPNRGTATVRLDGDAPRTLDLYSDALQVRRISWAADSAHGIHSLEISVSGNGGSSSAGRIRIDVDAFLVWQPV
jgi:hypothetical protein